jgi:hypothetical protein
MYMYIYDVNDFYVVAAATRISAVAILSGYFKFSHVPSLDHFQFWSQFGAYVLQNINHHQNSNNLCLLPIKVLIPHSLYCSQLFIVYSRSHNSVPVDRKKLNKTVKNNFFCFLSKYTYIYIYFTYIHIHF